MNLSKLLEIVRDREAWHSVVRGVAKSGTRLNHQTTATTSPIEGKGLALRSWHRSPRGVGSFMGLCVGLGRGWDLRAGTTLLCEFHFSPRVCALLRGWLGAGGVGAVPQTWPSRLPSVCRHAGSCDDGLCPLECVQAVQAGDGSLHSGQKQGFVSSTCVHSYGQCWSLP